MLPSHNCIIIFSMFSFQGTFFELPRNSMKLQFLETSVNFLVEISGIEPLTSCLQGRRSPSWAKPPYRRNQTHNLRFEIEISNLDCVFVSPLKSKPASLGFWFVWCIKKWWAKMDSNHRPHDYQSCALASWAIGPYQLPHLLRYIFYCTL